MNAKSTRRNNRRIRAIEDSARAIARSRQKLPSRRSTPRPSFSRRDQHRREALALALAIKPRKTSKSPSLASQFVQSCYADVAFPSFGLPSPNYSGPVTGQILHGSYRMNCGSAGSRGYSTVVLNPTLLPFTQFNCEKLTNGTITSVNVPTIFMNSTTIADTGFPFQDNLTDNKVALFLNGQTVTTGTQYAGKTRCLWIKLRVIFTGGYAVQGGELIIVDNPSNIALVCQADNASTGGTHFRTAINSGAELDGAHHMKFNVPFNRVFETVWHPSDLEFRDFSTLVPDMVPLVAGQSTGSEAATQYFPSMDTPGMPTKKGWTVAIQYRPPNNAPPGSGDANVRFEIESCHETISSVTDGSVSGVLTGNPMRMTTHHVLANSVAHDKVSNAIAQKHDHRRHLNFATIENNVRMPQAIKGPLGSLVKGSLEELGSSAISRAAAAVDSFIAV